MSETTAPREPAGIYPRADRTSVAPAGRTTPPGLIGLDGAGRDVALALLRAGHRVLACDPDELRREAYRTAAGSDAELTSDPAEVGRRCELVLLMLGLGADAAAIHGTLITALAPGGLIIDMGPALPGDIRRLAAEVARHGLRLMDAPLIQGPPPIVLAGGAEADRGFADPILQTLGTVIPTGAVGSGRALAALIAELELAPDVDRIRSLAAQQAAPW